MEVVGKFELARHLQSTTCNASDRFGIYCWYISNCKSFGMNIMSI